MIEERVELYDGYSINKLFFMKKAFFHRFTNSFFISCPYWDYKNSSIQYLKTLFPSYINRVIGIGSRVFANGLGDRGSIPGRVIPKTQKIVLDPVLLNTQNNKVRIKGKVEQSRERSSALLNTSVW